MSRPAAPEPRPPRPRLAVVLVGGALVAAVWLVIGPALGHGFIGYDDRSQVFQNPYVTSLAPANLWRMFTRPALTSYYGVRTLSLAIDHALWGTRPAGYHLTNLLLHTASVLMLYALGLGLARRAGRDGRWAVAAAGGAALLFAVHPVTVEAAAYIGAREEALALAAVLAAVHLHRAARARTEAGRLAPAAALHAGATLAAAVACFSSVLGVVVAPLLAAWDTLVGPRPRWREALAAHAPVWALAALAVGLKLGAADVPAPPGGGYGQAGRAATVLAAYAHNLAHLVWPARLALVYPWHVPSGWADPWVLAGLGAAAATLAAVAATVGKGARGAAVGLVWLLAGLAPSSHILAHHVYRADRLLYLPLAGLALTAAALAARAERRWLRGGLAAAVALAALALGWQAASYRALWGDRVALYRHSLEVTPGSAELLTNLGVALVETGRLEEGARAYKEALAADPKDAAALANLAKLRWQAERRNEALRLYARAVALNPRHIQTRYEYALLLADLGRHAEAARHLAPIVAALRRWDLKRPEVVRHLGASLLALGRAEEAAARFQDAVAMAPESAEARLDLATALEEADRPDEAAEGYEAAARLAPTDPGPLVGLARVRVAQGREADAIAALRRVVSLDPNDAQTHHNLGVLLARNGEPAAAAARFREALALNPERVDTHYSLAGALVRLDRLAEAAALYEAALAREPSHRRAHYNLGAVLARMRRTAGARVHLTKAKDLAEAAGDAALAAMARAELAALDAR